MSDGLPQLYWCRNPRGEKRGTGLLGLAAVGDTGETVEMVRLRWSRTAAARLRELARQAREGGTEQGRALPYASLRAVLQVRVPEAMRIDDDLGAPWNGSGGEDRRRWFADCSGSGGGDAVVRRACAAYATWSTMARWAERVGASGDLLEALAAEAAAGTLIEAEPQTVDCGAVPPDQARRPLLQIAAVRLQGQELFEGLGPVYRVVRSSAASNELVLQTWPKIYGDACYSMTATLAVETMPYTEIPVLTVRAGKRRWLRELADAARLRRFRSLSGYLMSRDAAAPIAVAVRLPVQRGEPQFGIDPAFMTQALLVDADLGADVRTAVARSSAAARAFFGVPHSPQRDGGHPVGSGAATRDHNDLYAGDLFVADPGMVDLPDLVVSGRRRARPDRPVPLVGDVLALAAVRRRIRVDVVALSVEDGNVRHLEATLGRQGCVPVVDAGSERPVGVGDRRLRRGQPHLVDDVRYDLQHLMLDAPLAPAPIPDPRHQGHNVAAALAPTADPPLEGLVGGQRRIPDRRADAVDDGAQHVPRDPEVVALSPGPHVCKATLGLVAELPVVEVLDRALITLADRNGGLGRHVGQGGDQAPLAELENGARAVDDGNGGLPILEDVLAPRAMPVEAENAAFDFDGLAAAPHDARVHDVLLRQD